MHDLKELVGSYEYMVEDSTRVMNRIKALYRSRAVAALTASRCESFKSGYAELLARGLRSELAQVTMARKTRGEHISGVEER